MGLISRVSSRTYRDQNDNILKMVFIYTCVSRKKAILAEAYAQNGYNFLSNVTEILKNSTTSSSSGLSIQKRNFNDIIFHIYSNNGFLFIVATEFTEVDEKAFDFLKCIQERFIALHLDESDHFSKGSLSQKFKTELSTIMNQYNTNKKIWVTQQSMQSLNQIKNQVDEVTEIMRDNVDTVLNRGEALDDMICRADDLQATTNAFQQQTTQINRTLYWKNIRLKLIIALIIIVIIAIIVGLSAHHKNDQFNEILSKQNNPQ